MFRHLDPRDYWVRHVNHRNLASSKDLNHFFSPPQIRLRLDERKRNAPRTLPAKRPRRLTFTDIDQTSGGRTCQPQTPNSPLFRLLPPELRVMIWEFVVADGPVVHMARLRGRMVGIVCRAGNPDERFHGCWGKYDKLVPGVYLQLRVADIPGTQGVKNETNKAPAILTTCRAVYMEVIAVLYEANCFHFNSVETIQALPHTIPAHRFHSIRSLSFNLLVWHSIFKMTKGYPHDEKTWTRAWDVVASMQGLIKIRVVLHMLAHPDEFDPERDDQLLRPIMQIPSRVQVQVVLEWGSDEVADRLGREVHFGNVTVLRRPTWSRAEDMPKPNSSPEWELTKPEPPRYGIVCVLPARRGRRRW